MTLREIIYLIIIIVNCINILGGIGFLIWGHYHSKESNRRRIRNNQPTKEDYERALKVQQEYYANKEKRK